MTPMGSANQLFRARVFLPSGELAVIERSAPSLAHLRDDLERAGQTLLSADTLDTAARPRKNTQFPLLVFCQQLLSLLDAGLQLVEAVDTLTDKEQDVRHRNTMLHLQSNLHAGLSFSQSVRLLPSVFPALFQATMEASEQTGDIPEALQRFIAYETQFQLLRNRLKSALIYPSLLLSLGGLVVAFLLGYVVPRFSVVFVDRLDEMPYLSSLVIRLGLAIAEHPAMAATLTLSLLGSVALLLLQPVVRTWLVASMRKIPWLGDKMHTLELVRMYRSLGMLLRGGIPAVAALHMIAPMVPRHARSGIERAIERVNEGQPISTALHQQGFTTVVSERLLTVGERSGKMGEMMERSAHFLDAELERSLDQAIRLLEPLMMVVIGVLIGGIVMLMYLPIFELADSVR